MELRIFWLYVHEVSKSTEKYTHIYTPITYVYTFVMKIKKNPTEERCMQVKVLENNMYEVRHINKEIDTE